MLGDTKILTKKSLSPMP